MADPKIGKAVLEIIVDDKPVKVALQQVGDKSDETAKRIKGMSQAVTLGEFREWGQIAFNALKAVGEQIVELAQRGAQVSNVETAFGALAASVGETKDAILETTRTATKGLIDDMSLMEAGNKAMLLGLPVTSQSMGTMAEAAVVLGRAMNQDAKKSFDDLITALGRGSPLILDNLGLTVNVGKANEEYARSLGKSVTQLTDAEKKTAFYNAAMAAARAKVAEVGGIHLTLADQVQIAGVTFQNFTDKVGVGINQSPVLRAGMEAAGRAIQTAFGPSSGDAVQQVVSVIEDLAIGATYVAQGIVTAADVGIGAWGILKTAVLGVMTAIEAVGMTLVGFVAGVAEMGAKIPVVGEKVAGFAAGARALETELKVVTAGMAAQTEEAAKSITGHTEMRAVLDKVNGTIINVRDAMVAAKSATGDLATTTAAAVPTIAKTTEDAGLRTAEQAQAIGNTFRELNEAIVLATLEGNARRLQELEFQKQAEILKAQELKGATVAEVEQMVSLINEKYAQKKAAILLSADEIKQREVQLQQEIQLAKATGIQQELLQLEFKKQAELQSIEFLRANYQATYEQLAAMIAEKYALMTATAQGHFTSVQAAAQAAGFMTRADLEATAQRAQNLYQAMLASGLYTEAELQRAREAAAQAQAELDGKTYQTKQQLMDAQLAGASTILKSLFGKSKAAAIAAALIDTYASVQKTWATYGWPAGIVPAAAALAVGLKNVQTIRSTNDGFREGTPGLDFASFGRQSLAALHGNEAVVPQGKGHLLAGEIAAAMPGSDAEQVALLRHIADSLAALPRTMARAVRDGMLLAG